MATEFQKRIEPKLTELDYEKAVELMRRHGNYGTHSIERIHVWMKDGDKTIDLNKCFGDKLITLAWLNLGYKPEININIDAAENLIAKLGIERGDDKPYIDWMTDGNNFSGPLFNSMTTLEIFLHILNNEPASVKDAIRELTGKTASMAKAG